MENINDRVEEFVKTEDLGVNGGVIKTPVTNRIRLDIDEYKVVYKEDIEFTHPETKELFTGTVLITDANVFELHDAAKNISEYQKALNSNEVDRILKADIGIKPLLNEILTIDSDGEPITIESNYLALKLFVAILNIATPSIRANGAKNQGSAINGAAKGRRI